MIIGAKTIELAVGRGQARLRRGERRQRSFNEPFLKKKRRHLAATNTSATLQAANKQRLQFKLCICLPTKLLLAGDEEERSQAQQQRQQQEWPTQSHSEHTFAGRTVASFESRQSGRVFAVRSDLKCAAIGARFCRGATLH